MKKLLIILILLIIPVRLWADLTGTEGLAIDLSSAGAGLDFTIAFDPTEFLGNRTWGDASTDNIIWTFNRATGVDPTITFNSGSIGLQALSLTGDILISGGNINTGNIALVVGDATTDTIQLLTDGTGDAEIALPNDAIGDAEINWATCTLADFDFETNWKMWHSDAAGDVTEITLGANGTFLESNGAAANPAFRVLADGDVPDNITVDLATLATTVTVSDDEATNDDQEIVFTTDNTNLESDGDFHYNPSTGTVTATQFVGGGVGGTTAWDDLGNPDNGGLTTITFDNAELTLLTGDNDAAASFVTIQNTDGDHTVGNMYLLDLDYSADDGDADADFIKCQDSGGTVFSVGQDGETAMDGGITVGGALEAATITEGLIGVPNLNETDWVAAAEMADADHGGVQWAAGVAYCEDATVADTVYASCYVGLYEAATGNSLAFHTDGGLTYDATSGTLSSTVLTEGGNAVYNSTEVPSGSLGGTYANITIDDLFILLGGDVATAGDYNFGSANVDLELPQTSPAVPDVDGQIELDFTDGKVVIQHGSAHAELGASTDVVVGTLIKSWSATIFAPDGVNDVMTVKAINSIEFPHGVVITAIYLGVSEDSNYVLTVQNFDDFDTINAGDGTIDTVTYTADTTGEIIDSTPTYATIAAGQIIMVSIPATDVDWIHFEIYYYEPAA